MSPNYFTSPALDLQLMETCDVALADGGHAYGKLFMDTDSMIGLKDGGVIKSPSEQTAGARVFIPICQIQAIIPREQQ